MGVGSATVSTIGHSLGAVPDMIIIKTRSDTESWNVYHQAIGNTKKLFLNTNGAEATTGNFDDTSPTSTLFTVTGDQINDSSDNVIAYCFKGIQGYSKFGSYEGNGIADGTFVYTGFKPAWLLLKQSNASGEHWRLLDSTRSTFNQVNKHLAPSIAGLESAETGCDFLSNGFKLRDGDTHQNGDGHDYVYAAFAEQPFVSSTGIPATAR